MSVHRVAAEDALAHLASFSAVIDARSESEWAHDHLPGALNWPSLHDDERVRVGTMYKQVSPFEAQKLGAMLVARNIASHIERGVIDKPKHWQPLLYCWRGGKRSGALALILGQIGFKVQVIEGGYKAFRRAMLADLPARVQALADGLPVQILRIKRQRGNAAAQLQNDAMESLDELTPQDVFARRLALETLEPPLQQALSERYRSVVDALTAQNGDAA